MKVSDILRVKGSTLFTASPEDQALAEAVKTMADHDIGSLVVMDHGDLVGMLTFREVIAAVVKNGGTVGNSTIRSVMDDHPLTCTPETEIDEVRRMMLGRHARYMPVMDQRTLMGVISFYDVAKAVVDRAGLREPHAQGLHPRLAGRGSLERRPRSITGRRAPVQLAGLDAATRLNPSRDEAGWWRCRASACRRARGSRRAKQHVHRADAA